MLDFIQAPQIQTIQPQRHLTVSQLADLAPAAFTQRPSPTTSNRYGFCDTLTAIEILDDHGFKCFQASQTKSRKQSDVAFADHLLRFRNPEQQGDAQNAPEIILLNSHTGKRSLTISVGLHRFACANGLILNDTGNQTKMRHNQLTAAGFGDLLKQQAATLPAVMAQADRLSERQVTKQQALAFAREAAQLRWDLIKATDPKLHKLKSGSYAVDTSTPFQLLQSRRRSDDSTDAYTILNRVQENLIRGGRDILSYNAKTGLTKWRKAPAVTAIKASTDINQGVFALAEAML